MSAMVRGGPFAERREIVGRSGLVRGRRRRDAVGGARDHVSSCRYLECVT